MKRTTAAVYLALCALAGAACSAALPPPSRTLCYAAADLRAQERVDRECRIGDAGVSFAECPAHDDIMAQLKRDQEGCR